MELEKYLFSLVNRYWRVGKRIKKRFDDSINSNPRALFENLDLKPNLSYNVRVKGFGLDLKTRLNKDAIENLLLGYFAENLGRMSRVIAEELVYEWQVDVKHRPVKRNFGLVYISLLDPRQDSVKKGKIVIKYQEDLDSL